MKPLNKQKKASYHLAFPVQEVLTLSDPVPIRLIGVLNWVSASKASVCHKSPNFYLRSQKLLYECSRSWQDFRVVLSSCLFFACWWTALCFKYSFICLLTHIILSTHFSDNAEAILRSVMFDIRSSKWGSLICQWSWWPIRLAEHGETSQVLQGWKPHRGSDNSGV